MSKLISVKVGGEEYTAQMVDGILRFKENRVIRLLVDRGLIDLNQVMIYGSQLPRRDLAEFWMMLGYSVDGFCDVFVDLEVTTPSWRREGAKFSPSMKGIKNVLEE